MPRVALKSRNAVDEMQAFLDKPAAITDDELELAIPGVELFRPKPRPRGRPVLLAHHTKANKFKVGNKKHRRYYDEERHPQMVFELRLLGLSDVAIARVFVIAPSLVLRWRAIYPEFDKAYTMGGDGADAKVAHALYKRAIGWKQKATRVSWDKEGNARTVQVEENFPPETNAAVHWLNNRQHKKWKDKKTTEYVGADGKALAAPTIVINPVMAPTIVLPSQEIKTIEHEQKKALK